MKGERCRLYTLAKHQLAEHALVLPCGCVTRLGLVRQGVRSVLLMDAHGCSLPSKHHVGIQYSLMSDLVVEAVPWDDFVAETWNPGGDGARERGCTCLRGVNHSGAGLEGGLVQHGGAPVFSVAPRCMHHGSAFGCDGRGHGRHEYNTVPRMLRDLGPLDTVPTPSSSLPIAS